MASTQGQHDAIEALARAKKAEMGKANVNDATPAFIAALGEATAMRSLR